MTGIFRVRSTPNKAGSRWHILKNKFWILLQSKTYTFLLHSIIRIQEVNCFVRKLGKKYWQIVLLWTFLIFDQTSPGSTFSYNQPLICNCWFWKHIFYFSVRVSHFHCSFKFINSFKFIFLIYKSVHMYLTICV